MTAENTKKEQRHIVIILGTNRKDRKSEFVANYLRSAVNTYSEIKSSYIDVRDYHFPANDYGPTLKDHSLFMHYRDAVKRADAFIIVTPEYNHSYPGVLKSLLDVCYEEYQGKTVGLVGVSEGRWGGVRVVESLLPVCKALGMRTIKTDLYFPNIGQQLDGQGGIGDNEETTSRVKGFIEQIIVTI